MKIFTHRHGPFFSLFLPEREKFFSLTHLIGCISNDLYEVQFCDWAWAKKYISKSFIPMGEFLVSREGDSCYCTKFGDAEPHNYETRFSFFLLDDQVTVTCYRDGGVYETYKVPPANLDPKFLFSKEEWPDGIVDTWLEVARKFCPRCGKAQKAVYDTSSRLAGAACISFCPVVFNSL